MLLTHQETTVNPDAEFLQIPTGEGGLRLRIQGEALRRLEFHVRQGLNAIPRGGLEIGGLVVGTLPADDESTLTVTNFVPVEIDYRFGPRYRPAIEQQPLFAEALLNVHKLDAQVIGCFRSHLGGPADVRGEDRRLLEVLLPGGSCCLFLVQAALFERSLACCYLRGADRELHLVHQFHVVPPGTGSLPKTVGFASHEPAPSLPVTETPAHIATPNNARRPNRWWLITGLAATLAFAAVVADRPRAPVKPAPVADVALLGLAVSHQGARVELRWDTASRAVRGATSGSLSIKDGKAGDRVELSPAQLQAGRYEYKPTQSDLTFVMILYQRDNSFVGQSQSLHVDVPAAALPVVPEPPSEAASARPQVARPAGKVKPRPVVPNRNRRTVSPPAVRQPRKPEVSYDPLAAVTTPRLETPPELSA